jgi:hypothetical protein
MKIKLKGTLPDDLKDLGLRPGMRVDVQPAENTTIGAVRFQVSKDGVMVWATVYPVNFKKI